MEMTVKDERKLVEIWLTNAEKSASTNLSISIREPKLKGLWNNRGLSTNLSISIREPKPQYIVLYCGFNF